MESISVLLLATVLVGGFTAILSLYCLKYRYADLSWNKWRTSSIVLLAVSFSLHTLGDYFSETYGKIAELALESIAHVIIFFAFLIFLYSSWEILAFASKHGFK